MHLANLIYRKAASTSHIRSVADLPLKLKRVSLEGHMTLLLVSYTELAMQVISKALWASSLLTVERPRFEIYGLRAVVSRVVAARLVAACLARRCFPSLSLDKATYH